MKRFFACLLLLTGLTDARSQSRHTFSLSPDAFLLDGKPLQLISGELHPARIPREYWQHRIRMAKAMGCNTIAAYVFWNYHEPAPGQFDFRSENRDIAAFVRLCQAEGLWVLLRPGPYVCAEWDFGGLPTWLLSIPDIRVRCRDPRYLQAAERYIGQLAREINNLQCTKGGPLLMVQLENEYGSYGNDKAYLDSLKGYWLKHGMEIPFFTADGPTPYMLEAGTVEGAAIGLDSGGNEKDFEQARRQNPEVPAFSSETYPGWLTHWGEKWARPDTLSLKKEVDFLLRTGRSFNFYVIHGGTNFGFTAGANAFSPTQYQPDITSYDYDAPINEQGRPTPKYFMLRELIRSYVKAPLPEPPPPVPAMNIPAITLHAVNNIWKNLPPPKLSVQPQTFEELGQNQGLVLYRTKLIGHKTGKLTIREPHDYALVCLNGKFVDTVFRDGGDWTVTLPPYDSTYKDPELDILVEGMGHINFAQYMHDRKGITERVTLNGMTLMNWAQYLLPMDGPMVQRAAHALRGMVPPTPGIFFKGQFSLTQTADTYFDLSGYGKGMVYINGHHLGRYWSIGPQQRLYCPASWLKKGENEIIVFDLHRTEPAPVSGFETAE